MGIQSGTAIVTGASRGIGRTIATELAVAGFQVCCTARTERALLETVALVESAGGRAIAVAADTTNRQSIQNMVGQTIDAFGRVDVLVNNAASFAAIGALWEVDPVDWMQDITVNLYGSYQCCRAVLPDMMRRNAGIIVNITGGGYDAPNAGGTGYSSSKAGLMRLSDTLALELAREYDIQVYALWPGFVRSRMTEDLANTPLGRKWLPQVHVGFEGHHDHPGEDVGRALVDLLRISTPEISGRIFSYTDNFDEIARKASTIRESDTHQLRYRWDA